MDEKEYDENKPDFFGWIFPSVLIKYKVYFPKEINGLPTPPVSSSIIWHAGGYECAEAVWDSFAKADVEETGNWRNYELIDIHKI